MAINREAISKAYENGRAVTVVYLAPLWLVDHPNDIAVMIWYVDMLYQMTRYEEALELLSTAIAQVRAEQPHQLLLLMRGHLERYRGNFPDAELWYHKVTDLWPDDTAGYVFLGAIQARQGKLIEAEATHRRGTQCIHGEIDESWQNLGLVLSAQGRLEEAANCFRAALDIDPEYKDAITALQDVGMVLKLAS